jgi:hypothetical protein
MSLQLRNPATLNPHPLLARITTTPVMAGQYAERAKKSGKNRKDYLELADELNAEFKALVESVRIHGVREPILIIDDLIVDGRHRWLAAKECGLTSIPVVEVSEEDVPDVIQDAVTRRHFSKGALAYMTVILHPELADTKQGNPAFSQLGTECTIGPLSEWASKIGVSYRLIKQAAELFRLANRYKTETSKIDDAVWAGMGLGALIAGIRANKDLLEQGQELPGDATKPQRQIDYATIAVRSTTSLTNAFDRWDTLPEDIQESVTKSLKEALKKLPLVVRFQLTEP